MRWGPAPTRTRTSRASASAYWLRRWPGSRVRPTVNTSRRSPSRVSSNSWGSMYSGPSGTTEITYSASSGKLKSTTVPPRVPNGSPAMWSSCPRSEAMRNVSAIGEGTGDPTARRLIFLAAARYRSIRVGEIPSTPAMLSKP